MFANGIRFTFNHLNWSQREYSQLAFNVHFHECITAAKYLHSLRTVNRQYLNAHRDKGLAGSQPNSRHLNIKKGYFNTLSPYCTSRMEMSKRFLIYKFH